MLLKYKILLNPKGVDNEEEKKRDFKVPDWLVRKALKRGFQGGRVVKGRNQHRYGRFLWWGRGPCKGWEPIE